MLKEGPPTNDPSDKGGATAYGISKAANPEAWADGKVTEEEARAIFETKYVKAPGFDKITDPKLQAQLIDYGFNSGPAVAIMKLQAILKVPADGSLGPQTLDALAKADPKEINKQLVIARMKMLCKIVQKDISQLKFLGGWAERALSFL